MKLPIELLSLILFGQVETHEPPKLPPPTTKYVYCYVQPVRNKAGRLIDMKEVCNKLGGWQ